MGGVHATTTLALRRGQLSCIDHSPTTLPKVRSMKLAIPSSLALRSLRWRARASSTFARDCSMVRTSRACVASREDAAAAMASCERVCIHSCGSVQKAHTHTCTCTFCVSVSEELTKTRSDVGSRPYVVLIFKIHETQRTSAVEISEVFPRTHTSSCLA